MRSLGEFKVLRWWRWEKQEIYEGYKERRRCEDMQKIRMIKRWKFSDVLEV